MLRGDEYIENRNCLPIGLNDEPGCPAYSETEKQIKANQKHEADYQQSGDYATLLKREGTCRVTGRIIVRGSNCTASNDLFIGWLGEIRGGKFPRV